MLYAQDFDYEKNEGYNIELKLNTSSKTVTKQVIDDCHCNPKLLWQQLGSPNLLTREQVEEIKDKSKLIVEKQDFYSEDNRTFINIKLRTNDVVLLTFEQ